MATVGVKTLIDFDVKNYDFYFFYSQLSISNLGIFPIMFGCIKLVMLLWASFEFYCTVRK